MKQETRSKKQERTKNNRNKKHAYIAGNKKQEAKNKKQETQNKKQTTRNQKQER